MSVRVTKEVVEVLASGGGTPSARVTKIVVEALATVGGVAGIIDVEASNSLDLVEDTTLGFIRHLDAASSVFLTDEVDTRYAIRNIAFEQEIEITDRVVRVIPIDTIQILELEDEGYRTIHGGTFLDIADSSSAKRGKVTRDFLNIQQTTSIGASRFLSPASSLSLQQSAFVILVSAQRLCTYSPTVGSGPRVIPTVQPTIGSATLYLYYPPTGLPDITVVLCNPEFGNRIAYNANRINRNSRGGTKDVYRDPAWPSFTRLSFDLSNLKTDQVTDFDEFLSETLGLEIGLTDHEDRQWVGTITTPDMEFTTLGAKNCGRYATSFEFEGELV